MAEKEGWLDRQKRLHKYEPFPQGTPNEGEGESSLGFVENLARQSGMRVCLSPAASYKTDHEFEQKYGGDDTLLANFQKNYGAVEEIDELESNLSSYIAANGGEVVKGNLKVLEASDGSIMGYHWPYIGIELGLRGEIRNMAGNVAKDLREICQKLGLETTRVAEFATDPGLRSDSATHARVVIFTAKVK